MLVEELKKADRMQKEFISIAAHELKTPIQAILGMSGLLKYYPEKNRSGDRSDKQERCQIAKAFCQHIRCNKD